MFINFSNHPSVNWSKNQKKEAGKWGDIVDISFPIVDSYCDEKYICDLAQNCTQIIIATLSQKSEESIVMCQGEFTLVYAVVNLLKKENIKVVAATSERIVKEEYIDGSVKKTVVFEFVRFREYVKL